MSKHGFNVEVSSEVLAWARAWSGRDIHDVAARLGVNENLISAWEDGTVHPTFSQLRRLSELYKRSLATLLLSKVPRGETLPTDYRTIDVQVNFPLTRKTLLAIRRAAHAQNAARFLAAELAVELAPNMPEGTADPYLMAKNVRRALGVTPDSQASWKGKYGAYQAWRSRIESLGVFCLQQTMPRDECRAFSVFDTAAPVIVVNSKEYNAPRSFSLLHELAHLCLHTSGICDMEMPDVKRYPDSKIEVYCNSMAGAALVPLEDLLQLASVRDHSGYTWRDSELEEIAKRYWVSKEVILRRLLDHSLTTKSFYQAAHDRWNKEHQGMRDYVPPVPQAKRPLNNSGMAFASLVSHARYAGIVGSLEAANLLHTKPKHLAAFEQYLAQARPGAQS